MSLETLQAATYQLLGQHQQLAAHAAALATEVETLTTEQALLGHVTATIDTLIDVVSRESMGAVEQIVTYGLRTVFYDQQIEFKLRIENKRGVQWAEPILMQDGVEAPILDAFGGGPAALASYLLRLLVCRRMKLAPLILLDEPFAWVSVKYRERLGALLRELADTAEVTTLMVTHEAEAYVPAATHAYEVITTPHGNTFRPVKV